jgi:preprotein translocase subunit SecA
MAFSVQPAPVGPTGPVAAGSIGALPGAQWRTLSAPLRPTRLPTGLDAIWTALEGRVRNLQPRRRWYMERAARVMELGRQTFLDIPDARLREESQLLRETLRRGREQPADIDRAYALISEVSYRQLKMRPFQVQVAAALALYDGCVAELATGEGKTLVATLPASVAGWRGRGCHVITVNDYLAARDAEKMSPIYRFCGLSVAHIDGEMKPDQRRRNYAADITYCTNKEVTADFLRDRLTMGRTRTLATALLAKMVDGGSQPTDRLVMRGLECAIIDEADSILIDEAVTPLIISGEGPNAEQVEAFRQAAGFASQLQNQEHFQINNRWREVTLTPSGSDRLAELAADAGGIWAGRRRREEIVTQALTAKELFLLGQQYVIQEGKVVIVDEFTGRLMPDRTWRDGLHQAVEAKEALEVQPPKLTLARISFQRFFRMYRKLCGMTGTAQESGAELWQTYRMPVVQIPTNRPSIRRYEPDRLFATQDQRWAAVVAELRELHAKGVPVLIGTRSVEASEKLSTLLQVQGIASQVLNAVRHAEEAQIVAGAGQPGRVTVATNMAGRGTDIALGRGVAELGGLHVIATERHESRRIDRQLFGRAARQGDPGWAAALVSCDDELIKRHAPWWARRLLKAWAAAAGDKGTRSIAARKLLALCQRRAQAAARRQRRLVLQSDDWLDENLAFAGAEI